ncbi:MAG: endonuclease III domain-containing protein [Pseudomonadota bacterium]
MSKNAHHSREELLLAMYHAMLEKLGPSAWWPASSPLEVAVGAVLTQNTSWVNVDKALNLLRAEGFLGGGKNEAEAVDCDDACVAKRDAIYGKAMLEASRETLEFCLRPSGFFRLKADRLTALLRFLDDTCGSDFRELGPDAGWSTHALREALLQIKGIGPETADSIVLYAAGHPSFVVDAYTRRIFSRHGLVPEDVWYDDLQAFFMDVLDPHVGLFNEYHALIVRVAKDFCLKGKPRCGDCPLQDFLEHGQV